MGASSLLLWDVGEGRGYRTAVYRVNPRSLLPVGSGGLLAQGVLDARVASPDGQMLAFGSLGGQVQLLRMADLRVDRPFRVFPVPKYQFELVEPAAWPTTHRLFAITSTERTHQINWSSALVIDPVVRGDRDGSAARLGHCAGSHPARRRSGARRAERPHRPRETGVRRPARRDPLSRAANDRRRRSRRHRGGGAGHDGNRRWNHPRRCCRATAGRSGQPGHVGHSYAPDRVVRVAPIRPPGPPQRPGWPSRAMTTVSTRSH